MGNFILLKPKRKIRKNISTYCASNVARDALSPIERKIMPKISKKRQNQKLFQLNIPQAPMLQEMHCHRKIMPKITKKCQNQKLFQLIVLLMSQEMHRHQLLIGWPLVPLIEAGIINIWTKNFHYDLCIGSLRFFCELIFGITTITVVSLITVQPSLNLELHYP